MRQFFNMHLLSLREKVLKIALVILFILVGTLFITIAPTPVVAQTYPACYVATNTPTPTPSVPFPSVVTPTPTPVVCNQTGSSNFFACYYNNINFTDLRVTRTEFVNTTATTGSWSNSWGNSTPDPLIAPDTFSATYAGTFNFASAGTYRFMAVSDDGVRVYVDSNLILSGWVDQAPTTYIANYSLSAGNHTIRVEYYENTGGAQVSLSWCNLASTCGITPTPTFTPTPTPTGAPPPISAPTCSISGASSLTPGQSTNYTANCSNVSGSPSVGIYWTPTSTESWGTVGSECSNASSCTQTAVFNSPGTYYVVVNGYKNPGASSATTRCTGNPFGIAPGWSDCGGSDSIMVTVASAGPLNHTLTVQSINQSGVPITGYYTTISPSDSTGASWQYTTTYFNIVSGQNYTVNPQNYAGVNFDHWQDNGSTNPFRSISINSDTTLVAVYTDTNGGGGGGGGGGSTGAGTYCVGSLDSISCNLTCNIPSPQCDPGTGLCAQCCVTTRPAVCAGGYATVNAGGGPIPVNNCNNSCNFLLEYCDTNSNSCLPN